MNEKEIFISYLTSSIKELETTLKSVKPLLQKDDDKLKLEYEKKLQVLKELKDKLRELKGV
jgi:hypothetical protein